MSMKTNRYILPGTAPADRLRVYVPRHEDLYDDAPNALTPSAFQAAAESATDGAPGDLIEAFAWARRRDPTLRGLVDTRISAVAGLDWELIAASDMPHSGNVDAAAASSATDFCTRAIESLETWDEFLQHNLTAVFIGVAVTEIIWAVRNGRHEIQKLIPVEPLSVFGDSAEPWRLRVTTGTYDHVGELLDSHALKFIVHQPAKIGPSPWGAAMMIPLCAGAIAKRLAWNWYLAYAERFGTPIIKGSYLTTGANAVGIGDRERLLSWIESLGHMGYGVFPEGVTIETLNMPAQTPQWSPHMAVFDAVDKQAAVAILGQPLSSGTQEGDAGSFALGKVQERVRFDIRDADIAAEATTIRNQIFRPMLDLAGYTNWPAPYFVRRINEASDRLVELAIIEKAASLAPVTLASVYAAAEIAPPDGVDLSGLIELPTSITSPGDGLFSFRDKPIRGVPVPAKDASPHEVLRNWVSEMVAATASYVDQAVDLMAGAIVGDGPIDTARVTADLIAVLNRLPTKDIKATGEKFLLASQLVGALNASESSERVAAEKTLSAMAQKFDAALEALRSRVVLRPDVFDMLSKAAKARAGRIAGMFNVRLVSNIYEQIGSVMESGGTLADFRERVKAIPGGSAWGGADASHVRLVWQQNATMAYQTGQYHQSLDAGVVSYTWRANLSSCPICEPYIGKTFAIDDVDPYPGFAHFGCDCWAKKNFAEDKKTTVKHAEIKNPALAEARNQTGALTGTPLTWGAKLEPADLASVPAALRPAFKKLLRSEK